MSTLVSLSPKNTLFLPQDIRFLYIQLVCAWMDLFFENFDLHILVNFFLKKTTFLTLQV